MHHLKVGPDWAAQIAAMRDAHSEDTNLIRFGNDFYRTCRESSNAFLVSLFASDSPGARPLVFEMRERDFYVNQLAGAPMGRYTSTFDVATPSVGNLNNAIHCLAKGDLGGQNAFSLRSLVVFCVAESIRNDHLATALAQTMRAASSPILGVDPSLDIGSWWRISHQWGQASNAIYGTLSPQASAVVGRPRAQLTAPQRQVSQYVDIAKLPAHLQQCAKTTKVLKRQG